MNSCVFPVAGFGTRFLPYTKSTPKELLPILNKPIIHYAVEEAHEAGLNEMILIDSENKQSLREYFTPGSYIDKALVNSPKSSMLNDLNQLIGQCNFTFIKQRKMLGLGHAIYQAKESIKNESFAVILPDDFCLSSSKSVIQQMREIQKLYPGYCIVAVEEVDKSLVHNYGVISVQEKMDDLSSLNSGEIFLVDNMIEKPSVEESPSNLAIIGRYILTKEIFDKLEIVKPDVHNEIQITNALKMLCSEKKVLAYKFIGKRFDCGNTKGHLGACLEVAKKNFFLRW